MCTKNWAHPYHTCTRAWLHLCSDIVVGTGHISARSALGRGTSLPDLRRDRIHPCHLCRLQQCARICSICTHSLFIFRSSFLRPLHSSPRPLPLPPITSRRGAPPLSSPRPLAFVLDDGEAHFLRAARWAVRWVRRLTYASEFSLFLPAQFGLSHGCLVGSTACRPSPAARARWTIEATTTKPQRQLTPNANV
jgi:hypothetical protein